MPRLPKAFYAIASAIVVVGLAVLFVLLNLPKEPPLAVPVPVPDESQIKAGSHTDDRLGLSIRYEGGDKGYRLILPDADPEQDGHVANMLFYRSSVIHDMDYRLLSSSPAMTIRVFPAADATTAKQWMEYHSEQLSFAPEGGARPVVSERTVGGQPATVWEVGDVNGPAMKGALVIANGFAYLFHAQLMAEQPGIDADFDSLLDDVALKPTGRLAAESATPAAPVCPSTSGETVTVVIHPDIPQPRCAKVAVGQALQVRNETTQEVSVWLGPDEGDALSAKVAIRPGESANVETEPADALDYGVHHLQTSVFAGPALWIVPAGASGSELTQ